MDLPIFWHGELSIRYSLWQYVYISSSKKLSSSLAAQSFSMLTFLRTPHLWLPAGDLSWFGDRIADRTSWLAAFRWRCSLPRQKGWGRRLCRPCSKERCLRLIENSNENFAFYRLWCSNCLWSSWKTTKINIIQHHHHHHHHHHQHQHQVCVSRFGQIWSDLVRFAKFFHCMPAFMPECLPAELEVWMKFRN